MTGLSSVAIVAPDPDAASAQGSALQPTQFQPTVLVVDDTVEVIDLLVDLLKDHCRTKAATNGRKALEIAASASPPRITSSSRACSSAAQVSTQKSSAVLLVS